MYIRKLITWVTGFLLSLIIFPNYLVESVIPVIRNDELGIYLPTPGSIVRWRAEGWGTTRYGKYGIAGDNDLKELNSGIIGIWGDSFVEGLHVNNSAKVPQQLNALMKESNENLYAMGIGQSGYSIADYYFLIPQYEKLANFEQHIIVFAFLKDILPDEYQYFSVPDYKLVHKPRLYGSIKIRNLVNRWGLDLPYIIIRKILKDDKNLPTKLRFKLGKVNISTQNKTKVVGSYNKVESFNFILEEMIGISEKPITFIYAPNIPFVSENNIIDKLSADNQENVELFSKVCDKYGFHFVNLSETFTKYFYMNGHKMPNGFANTAPGEGHWNSNGHYLVAKSILEVLSK